MRRWKHLTLAVFLLLLIGRSVAQSKDDVAAIKDFQERVTKYLDLHKETHVDKKPTDSPNKLAGQKQDAAEKIRQTRVAAKQGDIFASQISAYFKRQIVTALQGADGAKVRASLRHAEPLPSIKLAVNEKYPSNLPLQSTPPTLLLAMPRLPEELQYRVVGRTLVLYDVASNLIADFLPDAVPTP